MNYAVVVVNWNGADDTLACLQSLAGSPEARVIVVDNGSSDDSLQRIPEAFELFGFGPAWCGLVEGARFIADARGMVIQAGENLGFAAGANLGLRVAASVGLTRVVFLNNDTRVAPGALDRLVQRLDRDPQCFVALPMLLIHGTDRVWNCGGRISPLGLRRYHFAGQARAVAERRAEIASSFFTGCCFAIRTADFMARGGFSERFFFGEEDFELSLWMHARQLHALCLTGAVVEHKVSASFSQAAGGRARAKVFLYYLNRFIHMRLRWGGVRWWLWVVAYMPFIAVLLVKNRVLPLAQLPVFFKALLVRARTMDGVTRRDFEELMTGQWERS